MDNNTLMVEPIRPKSVIHGEMQSASAADLVKRKWTLTESQNYPGLRLSRGALVAVYGVPGAGKSTFAVRFANGVKGAAVYFSAEERLGPTVGERLERNSVIRKDFFVVGQSSVDDLVSYCRSVKAKTLVIDSISVTSIQPGDLRKIIEATGVGVLVFLLQVTKEARPGGSNSFLHESDVVIQVKDMKWATEKSRYQEGANGSVLLTKDSSYSGNK